MDWRQCEMGQHQPVGLWQVFHQETFSIFFLFLFSVCLFVFIVFFVCLSVWDGTTPISGTVASLPPGKILTFTIFFLFWWLSLHWNCDCDDSVHSAVDLIDKKYKDDIMDYDWYHPYSRTSWITTDITHILGYKLMKSLGVKWQGPMHSPGIYPSAELNIVDIFHRWIS